MPAWVVVLVVVPLRGRSARLVQPEQHRERHPSLARWKNPRARHLLAEPRAERRSFRLAHQIHLVENDEIGAPQLPIWTISHG